MAAVKSWVKNNLLRLVFLILILLLIVPVFLLTLNVYAALGYSFSVSLLFYKFVIGYIAYKEGWIKRPPRQRRIIYVFVSGWVSSFAILILWREFTGPLPHYSLFVFILLFAAGAYLSDRVWKMIGIY
ncbi:MAG: hypothetical protein QW386_01145 [Candidatus Bathyarchaeia archaeon]